MEETLAIIKPDAVAMQAIGRVISVIEEEGLCVIGMKMLRLSEDRAKAFYEEHKEKYFFERLYTFIASGPVVVLVLRGDRAITRWRTRMGATDYTKAAPDTLRRRFATAMNVNAVHGSDSPESAAREIAFFFEESELFREGDNE